MDIILTRRSIRKYIDKPVPENMINDILKAAMSAPSAGNRQPWHFVVLNDRATLDSITQIHPHASMLKEAPCAILVCGDVNASLGEYWVQDCSAATQNILLAANSLGLGSVWLGVYPRTERVEGIKKQLGIPEGIIPMSLIAIGFPGESKPPADRFNENRVHYNRW